MEVVIALAVKPTCHGFDFGSCAGFIRDGRAPVTSILLLLQIAIAGRLPHVLLSVPPGMPHDMDPLGMRARH